MAASRFFLQAPVLLFLFWEPLVAHSRSGLCSLTSGSFVKSLPKGWRATASKLHDFLECDGKVVTPPREPAHASEDYLSGLENPSGYFRADLVRNHKDEKLGCRLLPKSDYVEIERVFSDGLLARWNTASPKQALSRGDRLIRVNRVAGNGTAMRDELRDSVAVSLRVLRPSGEDTSRIEQVRADRELQKSFRVAAPPRLGQGLEEPPGSKVVVLHAHNADEFLAKSPATVLMFYAHWCGHCRQMAPAYTRAATLVAGMSLKQTVQFAKYNHGDEANKENDIGDPSRFNITSYPAFFFVTGGKHEPFYGLHTAEELAAYVKAKASGQDPETELKRLRSGEDSAELSALQVLEDNNTGTWRELLGRRTWFFLHTLAAKYPEEPSAADQASMQGLVAALGQHYPCPICRKHLQAKLLDPALGPVPSSKRSDLTKWFCQLHNMVNTDLGKPRHTCNAFELDLRYLKSCGDCAASRAVDSDAGDEDRPAWDYFKYLGVPGPGKVRTEL